MAEDISLHDFESRLAATDREVASLTAGVRELAQVVKAQQAVTNDISTRLTEIATSIKTQPRTDMGRLISLAASAGAVVAMLVAGITYIVTGSQQPLIGRIQADQQLLQYRLEQLEKIRPAPSLYRSGYHAAI